jgi:hypothetical protein
MSKFTKHKWWFLTLALTLPTVAIAAAIPYQSFTSGTLISSSQLGANFQNIEGRLAALEGLPARVTALENRTAPALSCTVSTTGTQLWLADCPTGYKVTGGGCDVNDKTSTPGINISMPNGTTGWACDAGTNLKTVYAICCKLQ